MNFLKFLVLVFFTYSVMAAENRGYIDFGAGEQSADSSAQQPGSMVEEGDRREDVVSEESPDSPVQQPDSTSANDSRYDGVSSDELADMPAQQTGTVRRSHFTSDISQHEPVDHLLSLANDHESVYFFTDLRNLEGQTITHRWEYNNQVLAEVTFNVQGPRWRVWSKKTLLPDWLGEIQVNVVDEQDRILAAGVLTYTEASQ